MILRKLYTATTKIINTTIRSLGFLVHLVVIFMVIVVVSNVIGRFCFNQPVLGTVELVELMMVVIGFFAMPFAAMERVHVQVEVIISRLSEKTRAILASIAFFFSTVIVAFITYQAIANTKYAFEHITQTTTTLHIPFAPFKLVMAFGCLLLCLRLLMDICNPLRSEDNDKGGYQG